MTNLNVLIIIMVIWLSITVVGFGFYYGFHARCCCYKRFASKSNSSRGSELEENDEGIKIHLSGDLPKSHRFCLFCGNKTNETYKENIPYEYTESTAEMESIEHELPHAVFQKENVSQINRKESVISDRKDARVSQSLRQKDVERKCVLQIIDEKRLNTPNVEKMQHEEQKSSMRIFNDSVMTLCPGSSKQDTQLLKQKSPKCVINIHKRIQDVQQTQDGMEIKLKFREIECRPVEHDNKVLRPVPKYPPSSWKEHHNVTQPLEMSVPINLMSDMGQTLPKLSSTEDQFATYQTVKIVHSKEKHEIKNPKTSCWASKCIRKKCRGYKSGPALI